MRGEIERAAQRLASAAGDGVNHAATFVVLLIGAVAILAPITGVNLHRRGERGGKAVVSVEQVRAFIDVAVTHEHHVHAVGFQDGDEVLAQLHQVTFGVGVVGALGVERVMEEDDDPFLHRFREIVLQPARHRARSRAPAGHGVEADEVDVAMIERVIFFTAGRHAAGLAVDREREDVEVGKVGGGGGLRRFVVAESRPEELVAQRGRIHVEDGRLMLGVRAAVVGVVAQHQPQIGGTAIGLGVFVEGVAGAALAVRRTIAGGARIAQDPEAHGLAGADHRRAFEPVVGAVIRSTHQAKRRAADRVKIFRVRFETGDLDDVLVGYGGFPGDIREVVQVRAVVNEAVRDRIRAPAHDAAGRRAAVEVRPAHERDGQAGDDVDDRRGGGARQADVVRGDGAEGVGADIQIRQGERVRRGGSFADLRGAFVELDERDRAVVVGCRRAQGDPGGREEEGVVRGAGERDGRHGIDERVVPLPAEARRIKGIASFHIHNAVVGGPTNRDGAEGRLREREVVGDVVRTGHRAGWRAAHQQVGGFHAGHRFGEGHGNRCQAGESGTAERRLRGDFWIARVDQEVAQRGIGGRVVERFRRAVEVRDAVVRIPVDNDRAEGRLREAERVIRVCRTADALRRDAVDEQIRGIHAADGFAERDDDIVEGEDITLLRLRFQQARADRGGVEEIRVDLRVEAEVAAVREILVEGVDGDHVRPIDERGSRGGHLINDPGRAVVVRLGGLCGGDGVVGNFAGGHVHAHHLYAVDPSDETVVHLGEQDQVGDVAAILDVELLAQVNTGVVALHVAERRAGIVRVGQRRLAVEERRGRVRPARSIVVKLTPGVGRVRGFGGSFDEEPRGVGLDVGVARVEREAPVVRRERAAERIGRHREIEDVVVRGPSDRFQACAKRRQGEGVVRSAAAHIQRRKPVDEQVRRIHSAHRFTEGDGDLGKVRHRRSGSRCACEDAGRQLVNEVVSPRRARTRFVKR